MGKSLFVVEPLKSVSDDRLYRVIRLENELTVLLVSDPHTDKASACMDVGVGHLWNPEKVQGLAHYLEHMLFLGNEKYPEENGYQNFVQEHGGMTNAYTSSGNTNFYFDISAEYLEEALDRFSQFFVCPTFTPSATQRELNAIESEYTNGKNQDSYRMAHFNQTIVNPKHPFSRFAVGSIKSLKEIPEAANIDVRSELLRFYNQYYSANVMKLVVLGKESLDELQQLAENKFSSVKNLSISPLFPGFGEYPAFLPESLPMWYRIVPKNDIHNLRLFWPMVSLQTKYKEKPDRYLGHLLGHESEGSLFALLKKKGWALQLAAGTSCRLSDFELFSCTVSLTEEGIDHIDDIIELVYQYLFMLKNNGIQEWIFQEIQSSCEMEFEFIEKRKPAVYTSSLAHQMHIFSEEDILSGPHIIERYSPDLIASVLQDLKPENMIVQVISKQCEGQTDSFEEWYQCHYTKASFPQDFLEKLKSINFVHPELHLPKRNEFIPTDFSLKEVTEIQKLPEVILDTHSVTIWHKFDTTYRKPKGHIIFQIFTPETYANPKSVVLTTLFTKLCQDSLNEKYTYYADIAGLTFGVQTAYEGMIMEVAGYNQKLPLLSKKIFHRMKNLRVVEDRFLILKEQQMRRYENTKYDQPYERAQLMYKQSLSQTAWSSEEKLNAIREVTLEDLQNFIPNLLSFLKIRILAQGNITKEEVIELYQDVESILNFKPITPSQKPQRRVVKLKKGVENIYQMGSFNPQDYNSCVWSTYQCGIRTVKDDVLLELLCQVIQIPCYEQLRTKEQLGYLVWTLFLYDAVTSHFCCIVQSPKKYPEEIDESIENFLLRFKQTLISLEDEEFQRHVSALISKKLQKTTHLSQEIKLHWEEILKESFLFNRKEIYADALRNISKEDLINFFEEKLCNPKTRRKLSLRVYGGDKTIPKIEENDRTKVIQRGEEQHFKNSMPLYPSTLACHKL